jgi:hypothetical protein
VLDVLRQSLDENNTIVRDASTLLRECGQQGFQNNHGQLDDEMETDAVGGVVATRTLPMLPSSSASSSSCWKKFLIEEKEPSFITALPILFIEAPLEEKDREIWMDHICRELCRANDDDGGDGQQQQQQPQQKARAEQQGNEGRQVLVFETLEDLNEHRSAPPGGGTAKSAMYVVKAVRSARLFANCIQGMAATTAATTMACRDRRTRSCCLVVLRPPCVSLDEERWSTDVHVKVSVFPPTELVIAAFWERMSSVDFPLAIARRDRDATSSSISATIDSVRRSIANILAQRGSFWAALPILPTSLIRRARSIHGRKSIVHMLPAIGCIPNEWNEMTKKVLIERLVNRYQALPREVQETAKDSLFRSVLWLDRLQSRHQLVRLVVPHYDGDQAQPRREIARALMDTSIGAQLTENVVLDAYGMRHLAVCGMGRIVKNGTFEKKAHVWCAGD